MRMYLKNKTKKKRIIKKGRAVKEPSQNDFYRVCAGNLSTEIAFMEPSSSSVN